jgi:hypothetical protein
VTPLALPLLRLVMNTATAPLEGRVFEASHKVSRSQSVIFSLSIGLRKRTESLLDLQHSPRHRRESRPTGPRAPQFYHIITLHKLDQTMPSPSPKHAPENASQERQRPLECFSGRTEFGIIDRNDPNVCKVEGGIRFLTDVLRDDELRICKRARAG